MFVRVDDANLIDCFPNCLVSIGHRSEPRYESIFLGNKVTTNRDLACILEAFLSLSMILVSVLER